MYTAYCGITTIILWHHYYYIVASLLLYYDITTIHQNVKYMIVLLIV